MPENRQKGIRMSKRLTVNYQKKPIYDIVIETSFENLASEMQNIGCIKRKICIVTDTNVGPVYKEELSQILSAFSLEVISFEIEAGESSKTLENVKKLYELLIRHKFERRDLLLALGGGVVGDLTGFAAATYLRGIDFIQIPTSLLAQVDSSIGGKTGVDFDSYKNMVGAFHQPKLVYMNLNTIRTLPPRQYIAGIGEILKHGLIKSDSYYEWVITNMYEIFEQELPVLEDMIYKSCNIKRIVVEKDPLEKGERALLNFGHTIGHAIEKLMDFKLLHGECVAVGSLAAAHISWKRGLLNNEEFFEIRDMFVGFSLPISVEGLNTDEILAVMKSDKKMESGQIKFVLLNSIGKAFVDKTVSEEELRAAIDFINLTDEIAMED